MSDKFSTATYAVSGATAGFGAMTAQSWGVVIGAVLGLLTLAANVYFKHQHLKLAREQARLAKADA